jgi:hypothetical protein
MIAEELSQGRVLQVIENKARTSARRHVIAVGIGVAIVWTSTANRRWPERGKRPIALEHAGSAGRRNQ